MSTSSSDRDPERPSDPYADPPRYGDPPATPRYGDAPTAQTPPYGGPPAAETPRYDDLAGAGPTAGGSSALGSGPPSSPPGPPPTYGASGPPAGGYQQPAYGQAGYDQPAYGTPGYGAPAGQAYPPAYGQGSGPAYGQYDQPKRNGLGIAALVLGILSLLSAVFVVPGLLLGLTAVILGFLGRSRARKGTASNGGVALAGLLTGAAAVVLSAIVGTLIAVGAISFLRSDTGQQLQECLRRAGNDPVAQQQCAREAQRDVQNPR